MLIPKEVGEGTGITGLSGEIVKTQSEVAREEWDQAECMVYRHGAGVPKWLRRVAPPETIVIVARHVCSEHRIPIGGHSVRFLLAPSSAILLIKREVEVADVGVEEMKAGTPVLTGEPELNVFGRERVEKLRSDAAGSLVPDAPWPHEIADVDPASWSERVDVIAETSEPESFRCATCHRRSESELEHLTHRCSETVFIPDDCVGQESKLTAEEFIDCVDRAAAPIIETAVAESAPFSVGVPDPEPEPKPISGDTSVVMLSPSRWH